MSFLAVNSLNACSRLSACLDLKITIYRGGWVVRSFRRVKSMSVFLGAGLKQANVGVGDFNVGQGGTVLFELPQALLTVMGLACPFLPGGQKFLRMAACNTWPVSLPVLTANAMVFCSISSCNCYPSFGKSKQAGGTA